MKNISEEQLTDTLFKYELEVEDKKKSKANVTILWFSGWPEFGVPTTDDGLRAIKLMTDMLVTLVCNDESDAKPLIHCRAGQGRTGTLLAIVS